MWAAARRYEGITDPAEAGELVDESFMPLLEHVPGFVVYYWIDVGDGAMVSLMSSKTRTGRTSRSRSRTIGFVISPPTCSPTRLR